MLPTQLLTPFQAERDHATRDMYTYATIQVHISRSRYRQVISP